MKNYLLSNAFNRPARLSLTLLFCCLLGMGMTWGQTTYTLVTNANDLSIGDKIIIAASDFNLAISTTQNNNNRDQATITKSENNCTPSSNVQILTVGAGTISGTFSLNTGSGYLYAASSSSNYLRTQATLDANCSWKITFSGNVANIIAQGSNTRNVMQYNSANSLFSCYGSASQKALCIYKEVTPTPTTPHTVTLHNGDATSDLTESAAGAGVTLPEATTTCPEYTFAGWTKTITAFIPSNFISAGNYNFTEDEDLYAVFAKPTGESVPYTESTSFSQPNANWTVVDNNGTTYWKIFKNNYIETPMMDLSSIASISIQMGTYGTVDDNSKTLAILAPNGSTWLTAQANNNSETTSYTLDLRSVSPLTGNGKLTFQSLSTSTTTGLRIKSITITGTQPGYEYTLNPTCTVATPTFRPEPGTYSMAKEVTLQCETEGATIEYAINPTAEPVFQTYTQPIQLNENGTYNIVARATKEGMTTSETASAEYVINTAAAFTVTLYNGRETYGTLTELSAGAGVNLPPVASECADYQFVAWTPIATEIQPLAFFEADQYFPDANTDLYAVYENNGDYTFYPYCPCETPTFSPTSGTYALGQAITIECATPGAAITYRIGEDGISMPYEGPIEDIDAPGIYTIYATSFVDGMMTSEEASATYEFIEATQHTVTFDAGTGSCETPSLTGITITLPTATPAPLCASAEGYTFAGWSTSAVTETNTTPTLLTGSYVIANDITLYAVYVKSTETPNNNFHKVTSVPTTWDGTYLIVNEANNVAFDGSLSELDVNENHISVTISNNVIQNSFTNNPTFTFASVEGGYSIKSASGYYIGRNATSNGLNSSQNYNYQAPNNDFLKNNITFNDNTASVSIDVTGNGGCYLSYLSDNNNHRFRYYTSMKSPIQLYKQGGTTSTAVYNSNPECHETVSTPTISMPSGSYNDVVNVTVTCETEDAEIRYTLDGSEPTETSALYSDGIHINTTCTLNVKAFKTDFYPSATATATYDLPVFVNSIEEYKAAGASGRYDENQRYKIMSELTVIGVSSSNIYIQDATGGLMVYTNQQTVPTFEIGDIMENVIGQYELYYGTPEIKLIASPEKSTLAGRPHVNYLTIEQYIDNFERYESDLICISDVHFVETNNYTPGATGTMTTLIDADNNTLSLYNAFKTLDLTLKKDNRASVTGIGKTYTQSGSTTFEISPRDNSDIIIKTVYGDTEDVEACERYLWEANNTEYTFSGLKTCIIPDKPEAGYDSVATINLTINHATSGDTTAVACGSFTWHGTTYTETPTEAPTFTMLNVAGCDSVVTLHLTINPNPEISISASPRDYLCEGSGDNITLSVNGLAANQTLLEEDFSTCTGAENQAIGNNVLSSFPTLSKIFPSAGDIKLGSGSGIGSLTSKALDLSNPFTVTISAKYYSTSENGPIVVTVGEQEQRITDLASEYTDYTLEFNAATNNSTITIATTSASKRAYISNVTVFVEGGTFLWNTDETTSSINVSPEETTTYQVTGTNKHNCSSIATKEIIVYPQPVAEIAGAKYDTLCPGDEITLAVNEPDETLFTYQWYKNNNRIESATGIELALVDVTGDMTGDYTVVATNLAGTCKDSSAAVNLLVNGPGNPNYNFTISAPADIYDIIKIGYCDVTHIFENPTATHYLAGTHYGDVTFTNDAQNPYSEPGDYTINWIGTDDCGNTAVCSQVLHISYEPCPVAVDNEGNQYPSVRINYECWTTENLRSTLYSDGTAIGNVMSYTSPEYPDVSENTAIYGHLYDWNSTVAEGNEALNTPNERGHIQGICPEGWYLPTPEQMNGLANATSVYAMNDHRTAEYWLNAGNNSSTLSLVPGGQFNGFNGRYENMGGNCYFWNAYSSDASTAQTFEADCNCFEWKVYSSEKGMGYSVRCIKERNE